MSSTPIYDELAAILLADHPTTQDAARPATPEPAQAEASQPVRSGGRRRKPEPDA
ncbi:hypothetical protein [Saccharothrix variisporea]|uniref:Uncharacterized protein n=1 Tax=Saccharothrix variisporea TaxID=543527 RepID=A0A495X4P9_9PSEU|nr:hypothetical protein [Saccharothrix variisporea]RKT68215.1 hypothetical protein DFJ66_1396 [Saccharothrix variisporea]